MSWGARSASGGARAPPGEPRRESMWGEGVRRGGEGLAPAARFHQFLRESEQQLYLSNPPTIHPFTAPRVAPAPPAVGDVGTFSVCSNVNCTSKATVTATAKTVGVHVAIFVDNDAPAG